MCNIADPSVDLSKNNRIFGTLLSGEQDAFFLWFAVIVSLLMSSNSVSSSPVTVKLLQMHMEQLAFWRLAFITAGTRLFNLKYSYGRCLKLFFSGPL